MTTANVPTASGSTTSRGNQPTLDDVLKDVTDIATTEGRAADGRTHLFLKVATAAYAGAIDRQKDKHGPGVKDNTRICEVYSKARSGATTFDTKPVKARKFLSEVDTMIRLGMFTKGGPSEPLSTLNAVVTLHQKMRKDATRVGELIDLPNALLKFAREQVKRETMLSEHEYRSYLVKAAKDPRTIEEWWDHLRKQAQKLKAGQLKSIVGEDMSDEMDKVINAANRRLRDIAKAKGVQPADAKTAAAEAAQVAA